MGVARPVDLPGPFQIAENMVYRTIWQKYPHKSFVSGLWLRDFEGTDVFSNCFARVLHPRDYKYFVHYLRNVVLVTPGEHALWHQGTEEERITYALDIEERTQGKAKVDWNKLKKLSEELNQEYKKTFPVTYKGIIGYKYTMQDQTAILSKLNSAFLKN